MIKLKDLLTESNYIRIGTPKAYQDINDLFYDTVKNKFMTPNYWDGSDTIMDPKQIKWGQYRLSKMGQQFKKNIASNDKIKRFNSRRCRFNRLPTNNY